MYTPGWYGPESGWKPAAAHPATPSAMAMQMMIVAVILMAFYSMIFLVPLPHVSLSGAMHIGCLGSQTE
jgi:hypothetical protein